MKAVTELSMKELIELHKLQNRLHLKIADLHFHELFEFYSTKDLNGSSIFSGKASQALIMRLGRVPTPDELIILLVGTRHNGAHCSITADGFFVGAIHRQN